MSSGRVAALVCEGQTDVPIFRAVLEHIWPELEDVRCLQPELDESERAKGPAGWTQVKAWCEANAEGLADVLVPDVGDPIDLLVIAIDVDIAIEANIANPPRTAGVYETNRLRETMEGWLNARTKMALPSAVLFSTPVTAIEAWVVAALFPQEKRPEQITDPALWLVKRNKLRVSPRDGKPWKELHVYRGFAPKVGKRIQRVRKVCSEVDRFIGLIEQRREALDAE